MFSLLYAWIVERVALVLYIMSNKALHSLKSCFPGVFLAEIEEGFALSGPGDVDLWVFVIRCEMGLLE